MKKRMKKSLALLLALVLTVSMLSACGSKDKDTGKSTETGKTETGKTDTGQNSGDSNQNKDNAVNDNPDGEGTSADGWTWPLEEKKELSVWLAWSNQYIETPDELAGIKKIEENTNVHVKWVTVNAQEAVEKFGLMMASGDYPDLLRGAETYYTGGLVQACSDGVVYDLTELIPQYMPLYQSLRTSTEKLEKDTKTDDGRLVGTYTLASKNGEIRGERVWDGLCIRQDWLDELKLSAPVTIDDWHNVLTAFKENYKCEAPLMIGSKNGYDVCNNFVSAYGVLGEFYQDNGTVKYGPMEDGYKQWVQLFHDWYAEGLIDQNFISNDASVTALPDYMGTGRAGASANIWGLTADVYKTQGYSDEEDFFLSGVTTPVLNKGDKPQIGYAMSELTKETMSVSTNCKDPELALRYLDYWYTEECMFLDSLGIEGESYVNNGDGTYAITDAVKEQVTNGEYSTLAEAIYAQYSLGTSHFGLYNWDMFTPIYEGNRATEAYDAWDQSNYDLMLPPCMTMTEEETVAFNSLYTAIQTLVQESTIKFITGNRSMDEYDSFVADLKTYGIDDCIAYKQAALDRYNAR